MAIYCIWNVWVIIRKMKVWSSALTKMCIKIKWSMCTLSMPSLTRKAFHCFNKLLTAVFHFLYYNYLIKFLWKKTKKTSYWQTCVGECQPKTKGACLTNISVRQCLRQHDTSMNSSVTCTLKPRNCSLVSFFNFIKVKLKAILLLYHSLTAIKGF